MATKLSDENIDNRLFNRNIKRLDNYPGSNKLHMTWQCTIPGCNYIWKASPSMILNKKTGCLRCAGKERLTNFIIDQKLNNRNIKRLNTVNGNKKSMNWQCLVENCSCIWTATPDNVLNNKSGCPRCAGLEPLSNTTIDQRLIGRNIKRLNDYQGTGNKINWQCLVENCNMIWSATPNHIVNITKSGCPRCSGNERISNTIIDQRIISRNIKRLGNCTGSGIKIDWQCLKCNYIWCVPPSNILNGDKNGCPKCSCAKNEKNVHEILTQNNINFFWRRNICKIFKNESRKIFADFYIPDKHIIVEYNGAQHYQPVRFGGISIERAQENFIKQQARDLYLQNFCDYNNIKLIWIDGRTYINDKLKNYLIDTIIPLLK